jgi:hypothetical protein
MPGSNSVIRRYTPPTCTLEILAQSSPLSRWMGQTVLNQLRFQLHFDDPALPEESKVPIQGDKDQLEALCNAVTNYVQGLLQKSADSFCLTSLESQPSTTTSNNPELSDQSQTKDVDSTPSLSITPNASSMSVLEATIYIEAGENLTHKLYLGSLANQTSGPAIELTLLQLFDLATALDEYSTDVIALPDIKSESFVSWLPSWTPVAAMLALGLGLTPLTWQYANSIKQNQQQTANNNTSSPEQVALQPSPSLDLNNLGNLPSIPQDSNKIKLPNAETLPQAPNTAINPKPLSFPNATIPSTTPPALPNQQEVAPPITPPNIPNNIQITPITTSNSQQKSTTLIKPAPIVGARTDENLTTQNSRAIAKIPDSAFNSPSFNQEYTKESIPSPQNLQAADISKNSSAINSNFTNNDNLVTRLRNAKQAALPQEVAADENKLFDVPQAAEAREFLQKKWQPPTGFSQTLEYSLTLGIDGTIERILPLNKAAREYIDNTGLPQIGKPFVSTNKSGQNLKLRVVFSADGKVQAFPEIP